MVSCADAVLVSVMLESGTGVVREAQRSGLLVKKKREKPQH